MTEHACTHTHTQRLEQAYHGGSKTKGFRTNLEATEVETES